MIPSQPASGADPASPTLWGTQVLIGHVPPTGIPCNRLGPVLSECQGDHVSFDRQAPSSVIYEKLVFDPAQTSDPFIY